MRAQQSVLFSNISATTAAFELAGGLYQLTAVATWGGGNAVLEQLGPDGTTYLSASAPITANGGAQYYLPPGRFRWNLTTATAFYGLVVRVPTE